MKEKFRKVILMIGILITAAGPVSGNVCHSKQLVL